jgi:hypothetical protein
MLGDFVCIDKREPIALQTMKKSAPSKTTSRIRTVRLSDEAWERARELGELVDRDRSWVIRELISHAYETIAANSTRPLSRTPRTNDMLDFFGLR